MTVPKKPVKPAPRYNTPDFGPGNVITPDNMTSLSGQADYSYGPNGMTGAGNIDLANRPVVKNKDGSISTVRSITITDGNGAHLIPTVMKADGKKPARVVSDREATRHYLQTGETLGDFQDEDTANAYAESLHEDQAKQYLPQAAASKLRSSVGKPTPPKNPFNLAKAATSKLRVGPKDNSVGGGLKSIAPTANGKVAKIVQYESGTLQPTQPTNENGGGIDPTKNKVKPLNSFKRTGLS